MFLANLKDTYYNCGVCEGDAVRVPSQLLHFSAKGVNKAYTTSEISTNENIYDGAWPVVINALIQMLSTKNVLREAHGLITRDSKRLDEDKLEFESQCSYAKRQCRHTFTTVEKVRYLATTFVP